LQKLRNAIEYFVSAAIIGASAYILFRLYQAARIPNVSSSNVVSIKDSAPYAIGFALYISLAYFMLLAASKYFVIFIETRRSILRNAVDFSVRFLSLVPTPFIIAIVIPNSAFADLGISAQYAILTTAALLAAAPTAMRIARDGFSGYSKASLDAAMSLGMTKWYVLRDIVSLEHLSLFRVAATISVSRIVIENWLALQTNKVNADSFTKLLSDPSILAGSLEQAYASANEKMGLLYVLILVALSFSGKIWSLIASQLTKP
jgi:ABC-type amino acid transport system permease subunit